MDCELIFESITPPLLRPLAFAVLVIALGSLPGLSLGQDSQESSDPAEFGIKIEVVPAQQPDGAQSRITTPQKNEKFRQGAKATPISTVGPIVIDASAKGVAPESNFDKDAAFGYLKEICDIGPRQSASPGMRKQQKYLQIHFEKIGGTFLQQPFRVRSPYNGQWAELHNIMIQWHPERTKRLLICCHHDTRPFADADPKNPRARFIGANDGGSGVALLCELGKHIPAMKGDYGVDFIFFDGEEFVIQRQRDPMFLGSTYFSQQYAAGQIGVKYEQAVLVDMVADKDLQIYLEGNSLKFANDLTQSIWMVAKNLGVNEFVPEQKHVIRDDHLSLNEIARIPTCDIIDFDYPNPRLGNAYWHTQQDKIENCSAESLGKVGSVVLGWLRFRQDQK